jgi:hypothetical protein
MAGPQTLPILPAPVTMREMLLAFALYDPAGGIDSLLNRFDLTGVTRRQVYFSVLGRGPETAKAATGGASYNPRAHIGKTLQTEEFQTRIRELILGAFPEKRRLIFVHIAKCAGTDLLQTLQRKYPYLHHHMAIPDIMGKAELFNTLRGFASVVNLSDSIAVSGHVPLRWYLERKLVRFEDDLFATVREPRELMYSYISFILTRVVTHRGKKRGDTSSWLGHIGMTEADVEPDPSPGYLAELGGRLLRARPVTTPNMLCTNLGRGNIDSALDAIVTTDIELTDTLRYSDWRRGKFGYEPGQRVNPSKAYFSPQTASKADRALVDDMVAEDMPLYERIRAMLDAGGALSVRGSQFA